MCIYNFSVGKFLKLSIFFINNKSFLCLCIIEFHIVTIKTNLKDLLSYNQYFSNGLSFNLNRIFTKNTIANLIIHNDVFVILINFSHDIIK